MSRDAARIEGALVELVASLFDSAEFRRFLRMELGQEEVESLLPSNAGLLDLVDKAIQALRRRRLLNDDFFEKLRKARPAGSEEIQRLQQESKDLQRASVFETKDLDASSLTTFGNADRFQLLFKVASPDFVRSTKAMQVEGGCILQVSTRERAPSGGWAVAEAVTFVPNVRIIEDLDPTGKLVGRHLEAGSHEAR